MPSMVNTTTFFQAQTRIVKDIYSNSAPYKPQRYPEFFNKYEIDMDRSFWQALSIVGFGTLALKYEGQVPSLDASREGFMTMYPFFTYALRYIVTKEMAREDAKRLIPQLPGLLRYSKDQTIEFLVWNVLNLGFLAAASGGYNLADGQPLFSQSHPCAGAPGITYSNSLGAAAMTVETLNQLFTLMGNMPDDRGLTTSRMPRDVWYPIGYHQTVVETLQSFYYPGSNENRVNSVVGSLEPHAVEYLLAAPTGPFPWFVSSAKGALGTDAHTAFANIKWDEQRVFVHEDTLSMIHEVEVRLQWGAVEGRGLAASSGA
ncbi:MAG: hypothetical protein KGL39_08960 [Patescibacteria group bacterium]|nr:hypothetical protein [Patescibacteria group bacterium]